MAADGMEHFGADHLAALGAVVAAIVLLSVVFRRVGATSRRITARRLLCGALIALLLGNDLTATIAEVRGGTYSLQQNLPLHLCDFTVYACVLALVGVIRIDRRSLRGGGSGILPDALPDQSRDRLPFTSRSDVKGKGLVRTRPDDDALPGSRAAELGGFWQYCYELTYYWTLAGTTQALLTPEISDGFPSRAYFQYFAMHGGTVAIAVGLTIGLGLRPRPGSVARTWLTMAVLAAGVGLANYLLDANYMYLCGPPLKPSLYDWLGPWPWTLVSLAVLGWVLMELFYLPFRIQARSANATAASA